MLSGLYAAWCPRCSWAHKDAKEQDALALMDTHRKERQGHNPAAIEQLPKGFVVGDKVRFKKEVHRMILSAHPETVIDEVRVVTGRWGPVKNCLRIDGPPHLILESQVEIAWRDDKERREGLTRVPA